VETSGTPQAVEDARHHGLLLLLLGAVLAVYGLTGFGLYALIRAIA
jgi:hypothetical protein